MYDPAHLSTSVMIHQFREYACRVAFSRDGRYLAAAGDTEVIIFRIE